MSLRMTRSMVFMSLAVTLGTAVFASCTQETAATDTGNMCAEVPLPANEWVGFHSEVALAPEQFHAFASQLFGEDAQAGKFTENTTIVPGIIVRSSAETATPDQARLELAFDDQDGLRRSIAVAPTSFAIGKLFIAAVDAAIANMNADVQQGAGSGEPFFLEYRVASAQGGKLSFGVRGDGGAYKLVLDVRSPRTALESGKIGTAAVDFEPYDTLAGTVWFSLSKDDFDFFTEHAYGQGATGKQNFSDFALVPHEWLRLTVDPHLDQKFVSVGFELLAVDGKRTPVAKAPASILAGATFRALVDRNLDAMRSQELMMPGSSAPWRVPFYYDDPDGGGVVEVIAQGGAGKFSIAYAVESPRHSLKDVPFVAHAPVELEPPDPNETASCEQLGDPTIVLGPKGKLELSFIASKTILNNPDRPPLKGTIYCSLYHKKDVQITGPSAGAVEVQSFEIPNADLETATPPTIVTQEVFAGEYQVLCFQDLDANGDANPGDPVTIPIGGYTVACNRNPATVEFAILYPK